MKTYFAVMVTRDLSIIDDQELGSPKPKDDEKLLAQEKHIDGEAIKKAPFFIN